MQHARPAPEPRSDSRNAAPRSVLRNVASGMSVALLAVVLLGTGGSPPSGSAARPATGASSAVARDGGATAPRQRQPLSPSGCPNDMVRVSTFCIDRYETSLVDDSSGEPLSPYYPPNIVLIRYIYTEWSDRIVDGTAGIVEMPLPAVPPIELRGDFRPRSVSRRGAIPQGYLSRQAARAACEAAEKRLCTLEEWVLACQGEHGTRFPYGPAYRNGACNVFREEHPGHVLHGSFSDDLLDPRMNEVRVGKRPLLLPTGSLATCASPWGKDAVFDMVGNLDEWVEADTTTFAGGFYARATRNGCDAKVTSHGANYFDYSTGARCCLDS